MSQFRQESEPASSYNTPHWVKIFGGIVIGLILLVVILQFIIGGNHGPNSHIPSITITDTITLTTEHEAQQP